MRWAELRIDMRRLRGMNDAGEGVTEDEMRTVVTERMCAERVFVCVIERGHSKA